MSLKDVADRAGVSTATVSRVLNNLSVVKGSTRTRVLKAVADLNYHPNLHARTLAGGKSSTIGMIASNLENPFFFDVFRALETQAHLRGYEVVVANTGYNPEQLVRSVQLMIGRRVAGLAVIVSEMDQDLMQQLTASRIPCVFYDVGAARKNISNIRVNYSLGIQRLVEHLYGLGHRRLAFVGHDSSLGPTGEREKTFVEAVTRYGDEVSFRTAADRDGLAGGRQAAHALLANGFRPSAIICVNDFMAVGVMRELRAQGLRVPRDVSVTGFDDIELSQFCDPPLTTVHIPREEIGRLAFEALIPESGHATPAGREIVLEPQLVLRESTGPAPRFPA